LNSRNVLECEEGLATEVVGRDDVVVEDGELNDGVVTAALIGKGRTKKSQFIIRLCLWKFDIVSMYNYMKSILPSFVSQAKTRRRTVLGYKFTIQFHQLNVQKCSKEL